jgi:hypothetical protein
MANRRPSVLGNGNARILSAPSPGRQTQSSSLASLSHSQQQAQQQHRSVYKPSASASSSPQKQPSNSHSLSISTPSRAARATSAFSPTPTPNSHSRGDHSHSHPHSRHSHGTGQGHNADTSAPTDLMKFTHTINDMDKQLAELKFLFRPMNPLLERDLSAIKIQALVRRWITQKKFQSYWTSISNWRHGRSTLFLSLIDRGIYRCSRISSAMAAMEIKKNSKLMKNIFERWVHICKQSAPFRRSMLVAAEEKYRAKIFRFKLEVFLLLSSLLLYSASSLLCLCAAPPSLPHPSLP